MKIYLASPMAGTELVSAETKTSRNVIIAEKLRAAGHNVYLPQENQKSTQSETLREQLEVIAQSDCVIAVLSDTRGLYLETGYAKGLGKKVYAIMVEESRRKSEWLKNFFDYIADNTDELLKKISAKSPPKAGRRGIIREISYGSLNYHRLLER